MSDREVPFKFSKLAIKFREIRRKKLLPLYKKQIAELFEKSEDEIVVLGVEETLSIMYTESFARTPAYPNYTYRNSWPLDDKTWVKRFFEPLDAKDLHHLMCLDMWYSFECGWGIFLLKDILSAVHNMTSEDQMLDAYGINRNFGLGLSIEKGRIWLVLWGDFWLDCVEQDGFLGHV